MKLRWLALILIAACSDPVTPEAWTREGDILTDLIILGHFDHAATVECQVADMGEPFRLIPVLKTMQPKPFPTCQHYREVLPQSDGSVQVAYPLYIEEAPIGGRYRVRVH